MSAYAPKEAYRDPDCLGAVYVTDDMTVNVRELVEASPHDNGAFEVTDPRVEAALDRYEQLKRVKLPDPVPEPKTVTRSHKPSSAESSSS